MGLLRLAVSLTHHFLKVVVWLKKLFLGEFFIFSQFNYLAICGAVYHVSVFYRACLKGKLITYVSVVL